MGTHGAVEAAFKVNHSLVVKGNLLKSCVCLENNNELDANKSRTTGPLPLDLPGLDPPARLAP